MERYAWDHATAWAICMAESAGNPAAINHRDQHNGCTGSAGLMQIACIHTGGAHELDPERNLAAAWEIYQRSGWTPWGAFTDKRYLQYM